MKKILTSLIVVAAFALFAVPVFAEVNSVTPSTNDENRTKGWAHVNQLSMDLGSTNLEFVSTRGFWSCFEYRTDGDTSQMTDPNNYNTLVTDGLYPYFCVNNSTETHTIFADEYVEVRMVFGAEGDERFDWTRFDVLQPLTTPEVTGFLNPELSCGSVTNIHYTTVDWTDSTGGLGGLDGYQYTIEYPLVDGSGYGNWSKFVTQSQYSGSLNEGTHTVRVRAKDVEGNYSEWSNYCSLTTDWTAPVVDITSHNDGDRVSGSSVEVWGSVEDDNPHHYYAVLRDSANHVVAGPGTVNRDDSFINEHLFTFDATLLNEGETYTIWLAARDAADNRDNSAGSLATVDVVVDNIPDDKDACKKDGWMTFTSLEFKNQGQCVSYVQANEHSGKRD